MFKISDVFHKLSSEHRLSVVGHGDHDPIIELDLYLIILHICSKVVKSVKPFMMYRPETTKYDGRTDGRTMATLGAVAPIQ